MHDTRRARALHRRRWKLERKRDYLAGFLAGDKPDEPQGGAGSDLQASVVEALKSVYDPEIPVDIYELGLIYDVDISEDGDATIAMTLTTPHCPVAESLAQRGRAARALGPRHPRRGRQSRLGPAVGPHEDERRSPARIGNAVILRDGPSTPPALHRGCSVPPQDERQWRTCNE